ncbi:MAG: GNAT family N-acetyltransferase [Beijerinckiaceae bacterium]
MAPPDLDAVIDLQWALNQFEDNITHDRVTDRESSRLCVEDNLANTMAAGGATLVAEAESSVIGYLSLVFKAGEPFVRPDKRSHGYVQDIVVNAEYRGNGVAQLLLAEAERVAKDAGLSGLALGMLRGNVTAERAYVRFGFHPHSIELIKRF